MSSVQRKLALTEAQKRDRVMDDMGRNELRQYLLRKCRDFARELYLDRRRRLGPAKAHVTPDEVRRHLENELDPPPWFTSRNWLGAVWMTANWEKTGETIYSETEGSHANELKCWRDVGGQT